MADMKIIERLKKKLTEDEWLQLMDYFISTIKEEERTNYSKGYQAGKKRFALTGKLEEEK